MEIINDADLFLGARVALTGLCSQASSAVNAVRFAAARLSPAAAIWTVLFFCINPPCCNPLIVKLTNENINENIPGEDRRYEG